MGKSDGSVGEILDAADLPADFKEIGLRLILGIALKDLVEDPTWGRPEKSGNAPGGPRRIALPEKKLVAGRCECPMCSLYRKGLTYAEVVKELGLPCSAVTVCNRTKDHGMPIMRRGRRTNRAEHIARIAAAQKGAGT